MSDEPAEPGQGPQGSGVLGNLPNSRPSVRSPRRDTEPPKRGAKTSTPDREPDPTAREHPAATPESETTDQPLDLEAIARGGIAVAGEAASVGLRLAGRAAAAVRDAVERR